MTFAANSPTQLVLVLPEPPSINQMIDMAKERTRRGRSGGFMKRALPIVYDNRKHEYEILCELAVRKARIVKPSVPWECWQIDAAEFRLHNERDLVELLSSLKWPIDYLVAAGFVKDDSPRELVDIPRPVQRIDRANRGITLTISEQ